MSYERLPGPHQTHLEQLHYCPGNAKRATSRRYLFAALAMSVGLMMGGGGEQQPVQSLSSSVTSGLEQPLLGMPGAL